ncbi:MAG: TldD/PmbA family protein [Candidatus Odinarchaeota archaeon]
MAKSKLVSLGAEELADKIIISGMREGADEFQVKIRDTEACYVRYANSEIHQISEDSLREIRMVALIGKKKGFYSVVPVSDEELLQAAKAATKLAKVNAEDPKLLSFHEAGGKYARLSLLDNGFEHWNAGKVADTVNSVINAAHDYDERVTSVNGSFQLLRQEKTLVNSNSLSLSSKETSCTFSVNVLAVENSKDARNSQSEANRFSDSIPFEKLAKTAARYAVLGLNPKKLEPGKYSAILDYQAMLEPLVFTCLGLSGMFALQHRSFLAQKMGQQIFSERFTLEHDPHNPEIITSSSFDDEGLPTKKFNFIERGILREFAHDRWSASQMKNAPNSCGYESERTSFGIPFSEKLQEGTKTTEELIKTVDNGIFVSRLFYTNWSNPLAGILTGTTRNGFFKIEKGEITTSLLPMRHTTSIFEMFGEGYSAGNILHQPQLIMMPGVMSLLVPAASIPVINMTTYAN